MPGLFISPTRRVPRPVALVRPAQGISGDADLGRRRSGSSFPFPDTRTIEYPERAAWQALSERRIKRYGDAEYLFDRDEKTKAILSEAQRANLDELPGRNSTLEDVLKYIDSIDPGRDRPGLPTGIPIYVDPQGITGRRQDNRIDRQRSTSTASRFGPRFRLILKSTEA